jgi:hypothetical protein
LRGGNKTGSGSLVKRGAGVEYSSFEVEVVPLLDYALLA